MPLYTFRLFQPDGEPHGHLNRELAHDCEALDLAGHLLEQHLQCDHVEIWDGELPVISRYRFKPVIRTVVEPAIRTSGSGRGSTSAK